MEVIRYEIKYLLNPILAQKVQRDVAGIFQKDIHTGVHGYLVRSLYFDTVEAKDYWEKQNGECNRQKVRIRMYGTAESQGKLEIKGKQGDCQRKRGLILEREDIIRIENGEYECLLNFGSNDYFPFYTMLRKRAYLPKLYIDYERMAYCYPCFDVRVTFDRNIRARRVGDFSILDKETGFVPAGSDVVIMEIKYNQYYPAFLNTIFDKYDITRVSYGKYEKCYGRIYAT